MTTKQGDRQIEEEVGRIVNSGLPPSVRLRQLEDKIAETERVVSSIKKRKDIDVCALDYANRLLRALEKAQEELWAQGLPGPVRR